ncbi:DUF4349 domain-containing protein [Blastococcus sp. SYSU DS1021]
MAGRRIRAGLVTTVRVAIGHRRRSVAAQRPAVRPVRRFLGAAAAALALALLAGCTGSPGAESGSADGGAGGGAVAPVPAIPGDLGSAPDDPLETDGDRQVVTTASASVAVEDPAEGAQQVNELVESVGGRIEERTEQTASGDGTRGAVAELVVRVPASELTGVVAELEDLGDVANVSVSHSDVTTTVVDLDARIAALQTSVARLQTLMEGAADTEALLAAEKALSDRQEQLESLLSRRALLADRVELSTLRVHLEPFGVAPPGGPDGFLGGLGTGWRALASTAGSVAVVLGVVLPWVAVAALVAGAVLVPVRRARRRAPAAAPPPATPPPAPPTTPQG